MHRTTVKVASDVLDANAFRVGEDARAMIASVTEGEDKPRGGGAGTPLRRAQPRPEWTGARLREAARALPPRLFLFLFLSVPASILL